MSAVAASEPLLSVRDLRVHYAVRRPGSLRSAVVQAVEGISFDLMEGQSLGLVGESGSGKTTLARSVLRLIRPTSGEIFFGGRDITRLSSTVLKPIRREFQIVFQNPFSSLHPRLSVLELVTEPLKLHQVGTAETRRERAVELLDVVGLGHAVLERYPRQLSGGQQQRVAIARALALRPRLLVCDEPLSALDVSVQAQVINLLRTMRSEFGLTYLFISHDIAAVRQVCDRVGVMYLGKLVETAPTEDLLAAPQHPYSKALIASIPELRFEEGPVASAVALRGEPPSPANPPPGCRFHTRCPVAIPRCREEEPVLRNARAGSMAACHLVDALEEARV